MDSSLDLLAGIPTGGNGVDGGGGGGGEVVPSSASILTRSNDDDDVGGLELGLGLRIGGRLKTKEEGSRMVTDKGFSSCSSSSSSSVNIPNSSIVGTKRAAVDSLSPPNATSVVGWPPIRRSNRNPILAHRIKPEKNEFSSRPVNNNRKTGYLSVKVKMDGTLIGRKVDLNAHTSYETLAQTLEDMFHGGLGSSRILNGTSGFLLTYDDKDGDCMLVGDVPWQMFLNSVKRLRILRIPKSIGSHKKS